MPISCDAYRDQFPKEAQRCCKKAAALCVSKDQQLFGMLTEFNLKVNISTDNYHSVDICCLYFSNEKHS